MNLPHKGRTMFSYLLPNSGEVPGIRAAEKGLPDLWVGQTHYTAVNHPAVWKDWSSLLPATSATDKPIVRYDRDNAPAAG